MGKTREKDPAIHRIERVVDTFFTDSGQWDIRGVLDCGHLAAGVALAVGRERRCHDCVAGRPVVELRERPHRCPGPYEKKCVECRRRLDVAHAAAEDLCTQPFCARERCDRTHCACACHEKCPTCRRPLPRTPGRPRVALDAADVRKALAECGSQRKAAAQLGVSESALRSWIKRDRDGGAA